MRSMNNVELSFKVINGKMEFELSDYSSRLNKFLRSNEGSFGIAIFEIYKYKTWRQLKFFHGPLLLWYCDVLGLAPSVFNKQWIKKFLKRQFVSTQRDLEDIKVIQSILGNKFSEDDRWFDPSLKNFSKAEMCGFITNCINFLPECGGGLNTSQYNEYQNALK